MPGAVLPFYRKLQIFAVEDVIAVANTAGLVAGQLHGGMLGNVGARLRREVPASLVLAGSYV
jgi:hypothetical protein